MNFHALNLGDLSMFGQHPELLQNFVELFFIGHGKNFLRSDLAMMKFNTPVGQPRNYRIVRDHHNRPPLPVKLA